VTDSAADIFVSYKSEDRPRIRPLVNALEAEGFSVWWDVHIGGGANWHQTIEKHLESASCVIVSWTSASVGPEGHFVRDEARRARGRGVYLPILLDAVLPPLGFGEIQALSLQDWNGDRSDSRFQAIINAVRRQISGGKDLAPIPAEPAAEAVAPVAKGASLAVLAFADLTRDPEKAYLADGIAEELIVTLSRFSDIRIPARTSSFAYRGRDIDVRTIGRELGVGLVLEGSVRAAGVRVRVTVQLIDAATGFHRWAESFERATEDLLTLQVDLAEAISRILQSQLRGPARAPDAEAYALHVQARGLAVRASPSSLTRAIELHRRVIERDPGFARGWTAFAGTLMVATESGVLPSTALAEARAAAAEAIRLDPAAAGAFAIGATLDAQSGRWLDAAAGFQAALELDASEPNTLLAMAGSIHEPAGQLREAGELARRAVELAPASANVRLSAAYHAYLEGEMTLAREHLDLAALMGVNQGRGVFQSVRAELALADGAISDAAEGFAAVLAVERDLDPERIRDCATLASAALGGAGDPEAALQAIRGLARDGETPWRTTAPFSQLLTWLTALGDVGAAHDVADKLVLAWRETGRLAIPSLRRMWRPDMEAFRTDPRFPGLVRALGLPALWGRIGPPDSGPVALD